MIESGKGPGDRCVVSWNGFAVFFFVNMFPCAAARRRLSGNLLEKLGFHRSGMVMIKVPQRKIQFYPPELVECVE